MPAARALASSLLVLVLALSLSGCGLSVLERTGDDGWSEEDLSEACRGAAQREDPIVIPVFPEWTTISGVPNTKNFFSATAEVEVPRGCYSEIKIRYAIKTNCYGPRPAGQWQPKCDPFDRNAFVSLVDPNTVPLFLIDGATSFGTDHVWEQDITDYASKIFGKHKYMGYIRTQADPTGKASGVEAQMDMSVTLVLTPGPPPRRVVSVQPLFYALAWGKTSAPIKATVTAPEDVTNGRIDFYVSGHGLVGTKACDEFCKKENVISVGGQTVYAEAPWVVCGEPVCGEHLAAATPFTCMNKSWSYRCGSNLTSCPGSAVLDRANWCPGRKIELKEIPLPEDLLSGSHDVTYAVENLEGNFWIGAAAVFWR
jgi:hypothetical protein